MAWRFHDIFMHENEISMHKNENIEIFTHDNLGAEPLFLCMKILFLCMKILFSCRKMWFSCMKFSYQNFFMHETLSTGMRPIARSARAGRRITCSWHSHRDETWRAPCWTDLTPIGETRRHVILTGVEIKATSFPLWNSAAWGVEKPCFIHEKSQRLSGAMIEVKFREPPATFFYWPMSKYLHFLA